jgi:pyridoxine 5-phosphate synthase
MNAGTTSALRLGVNIDHVATLRQQRGTRYPDIVRAAGEAMAGGADLITVHLREDRRHIQDADVLALRELLDVPLNLEMALTGDMLDFAVGLRPDWVCLVPEKRAELTTEGGLDARALRAELAAARTRLAKVGVRLSLFLDPDPAQLDVAAAIGADAVELHTGEYAEADGGDHQTELQRLAVAARHAAAAGLGVHAGHGLNLENVAPIASLAPVTELNIGHAIVADAVFRGLRHAVAAMRAVIDQARADAS